MTSSYSYIFENITFINRISPYVFIDLHNSFAVSLVYILFGKIIAENKFQITRKVNIIFLIISTILLYVEWRTIYNISEAYNNDCYLMLLPTALLIFNYLKDIKIKLKESKKLRQLSNFIYPLHGSVAVAINAI